MRLFLVLLLAATLWAQNPQTAVYPGAVAADKDLGVQVNRFQTLLTNPIGTTDTTLTLQSTAGLVAYTYLGIDFEYMMVCAVVNATTVTIGKTSCPNVNGRGLDGTSVAAHLGGKTAAAYLIAGQYNQTAAEVKAIENWLKTQPPAATDPLTTKGDIAARTATATVRLPIGTVDGQALTVDSTQTTGLRWITPTGGPGSGVASVTSPTNTLTCAGATNVTCDVNYALTAGTAQNNDLTGNNNVTINYLSRLRPNSATGTGMNKLVKYVGTPSTVQTIATTDTGSGIVIGGCVAACGTSGNARIVTVGDFPCAFDGATTANHYVVASTTAAGSCHDSATLPATGNLGQILSTNVGAGTYIVDLHIQ